MWCLPVNVTDDEEPEPPQRLQVELFAIVSDVNVVPVRRVVNLTIIDDDLTSKHAVIYILYIALPLSVSC